MKTESHPGDDGAWIAEHLAALKKFEDASAKVNLTVGGKQPMIDQDRITIQNMSRYGGEFVKCLANAALHADAINLIKLKEAFPEYWHEYANFGRKDT